MTTLDRPAATPLRGIRALDEEDVGLLVDSPALQQLMDGFQKFSGLAMAIIDPKGKVLVAAGWQEICTRFHRIHPETCRHCVESDIHLSANLDEGKYSLYKCKNGLWDMATPIVLDGQHVANVFNGQFSLEDEPLDAAVFERQAERYGFDRAAYLAALAKVPRVSRQRAQEVMEFYVALARMRQARPGIRVLFMSGYTEHGVALQRQFDHGSAFLQKPFSASALAQRVRELLDRGGAAAPAPDR